MRRQIIKIGLFLGVISNTMLVGCGDTIWQSTALSAAEFAVSLVYEVLLYWLIGAEEAAAEAVLAVM